MKQHDTTQNSAFSSQADSAEIGRFNALAAEWWNIHGPMAPLHRLNPTRIHYITKKLREIYPTLNKRSILDIGCGGGLVCEPMARLGATMTGIDGAADLIAVAKIHAAEQNLPITYRAELTEALIAEKKAYDAVLALEVIEHVPDPVQFVTEIAALTKKNGLVVFSTLNRTPASMALGVVAAEYVLRWLPAGTHDWKKFVKPSELFALCEDAGLEPIETMGLVYRPLKQDFVLDEHDLKVNYFLVARKK